jgi:hypothetical protein
MQYRTSEGRGYGSPPLGTPNQNRVTWNHVAPWQTRQSGAPAIRYLQAQIRSVRQPAADVELCNVAGAGGLPSAHKRTAHKRSGQHSALLTHVAAIVVVGPFGKRSWSTSALPIQRCHHQHRVHPALVPVMTLGSSLFLSELPASFAVVMPPKVVGTCGQLPLRSGVTI